MLTATSQITPRVRCAGAGAAVRTRVLGSTSAALIRHRQQIRDFRFGGIWSSYLDPEFHRELRRRQRMIWCKHAQTLNRQLSWEKHPFAEDTKTALRRMFKDYWRHGQGRQGRRYAAAETVHEMPDNPTGVRPGRNIEDAERAPMEHLLFGNRSGARSYEYDYWSTPLQNIKSYMEYQRERMTQSSSPKVDSSGPAEDATSDALTGASGNVFQDSELEYVIDPITNRKVTKSTSPLPKSTLNEADVEIPIKTYQPQFTPFQPLPLDEEHKPVFYDGPPPAEELKKYDEVKIDSAPWESEAGQTAYQDSHAKSDTRSPVLESDDYVRSHAANHSSNISTIVGDNFITWKYKGFFWQKGDGVATEPVESSSKNTKVVDDLFPFWPDTQTAKEPRKNSDLDKYKPIVDIKEAETATPTRKYDDLSKYKPVMTPDPDLATEPVAAKELNQYIAVKLKDLGDDGKAVKEGPANPQDIEGASPQELGKYQAVRYQEPDGQPTSTTKEGYCDPEEVQKYNAVRFNEPDGKLPGPDEDVLDPNELGKYQAFRYNEPDGKPPLTEEEGHRNLIEVRKYKAVRYNEPDGKPVDAENEADYDPVELGKYGAFRYHEPDGKLVQEKGPNSESEAMPASPAKEKDSLSNLRASDVRASVGRDLNVEPEREKSNYMKMLETLTPRYWVSTTADPETNSTSSKAHSLMDEVGSKAPPATKKWTGNYALDFPEDFEGSWSTELLASSAEGMDQPGTQDSVGVTRLQPAIDRHGATKGLSSTVVKHHMQADPYSREPQGLETSYKEECAGASTWPTYIKSYGSIKADEDANAAISSDPMSSKAGEALAQELKEIYEDSYGPISTSSSEASHSAASTTEGAAIPEPTVYKILVYDPTMQAINTAETTSIVSDSSAPLTPAEVLLRLSNPVKFFPHFAPLQAQGYDIVSGSGDVLVFRKVRNAVAASGIDSQVDTSAAAPFESANKPSASASDISPPSATGKINPIDLMGRRPYTASNNAAGNFASPTGFVNYDLPPFGETAAAKAVPRSTAAEPFRSGIDVHREEAVFSGAKAGRDFGEDAKARPGRKSVAKRVVVGAAWVAGVSYALGVVGEYFTTGGVDGGGPKGF